MNTFRKSFVKSFIKRKPFPKASAKAQSAMEYLMTYGWAILIISVVLAALFQLGVFNPMTFAPKAPPGSCQVFRPNGPGTTSFINLEGVCSGELPQYVAQFNGNQNSYINIGNSNLLNIVGPLTVTAWVNALSNGGGDIYEQNSCNSQYELFIEGGNVKMRVSPISGGLVDTGGDAPLPTNIWVFVAGTFNITDVGIYINGIFKGSATVGNTLVSHPGGYGYIGELVNGCTSYDLNGNLANVQVYNTSLSANEIQALYQEGIGGAPIDLQHLVGWWPLNGNANDYSGNGNNGQTSNVNFVSNWYSGYTPP